MCRYYYGEGQCANLKIDGDVCAGQQTCNHFSNQNDPGEDDCDSESWFGLYCAKYKRFFCPGKDNCQTYEEYARSLEAYLSSEERI